MPNKHLKYGGSTMERTLNCPAWVSEAETVPAQGSSIFADEGTMLHNCAELYFTDDTAILADMVGKERYGDQVLTDDLLRDKLVPAVEAAGDLLEKHEAFNNYICEPFVELIPDEAGGSIDMLSVSDDGKTALIIDYKFGHVTVSAENNSQLMFYALCAMVDPATANMFKRVERVVLAIVQPNDDGGVLSECIAPIGDFDAFELSVYQAIEDSKTSAPKHKGGSWCKYCPAHATCHIKTGLAAKAQQLDPAKLTDLGQALTMVPELQAWIKSVEKMAYEQLEAGAKVDGFKLVNKRASRVWSDDGAVADIVRKMRKVKIADAFNSKLKSPAQLEKVFKKEGVDTNKISDYIISVSSGTTVAKADDKRPDATPRAALAALAERLA